MSHNVLPFFFRKLPSERYLISNLAGFHEVLASKEKLVQILDDTESLAPNALDKLRSNLMIAPEENFELSAALLCSAYAQRITSSITQPNFFMLVPTLRCDHDCTYCQVSRVAESKKGFDIDQNKIDEVIRFLASFKSGPIKVEFQGGEPLLRFDLIKQVVLGLQKLRKECFADSFVIATSLSTLTKEILDWVKPYPIQFSVSLDGLSDTHNSHRRHRSIDSWQTTMSGIRSITEELGKNRVATVTTITKTSLEYPEELIDVHRSLQLEDMFVRPLSPYGFASYGLTSSYSTVEYFEFYKKLLGLLAEDGGSIIEHSALLRLKKLFGRDSGSYIDLKSPAGYILGALVIDYDGAIYGSDEARMLYRTRKIEELKLGSVSDDEFRISRAVGAVGALEQSFLSESPGCDECAYQSFCGADPIGHLQSDGDVLGNKSNSSHCDFETRMFDLLVDSYYQDIRIRKMFDRWLAQ